MMWGRTARLPLKGGGLALPPIPPYTAAKNVRISAALLGLLGLAWLLAELPLLLSAAAIAAVTATLLLLRFPHLIWLGLAVALPFASGFKIGPISIADCILGAAVLLWFANGVRTNRLRLNTGLLPLLFIIYLLALLLSFRNAIDVREASEGVIKWLQMLIAILLIQEALTPRQVRWLVWGLLTGAMLQSALGLYQFVFRIGPPNFLLLGRFMRAAGTFGQPNPFAGYLGLTLPVAVALFMLNLKSIVKLSGTSLKQGLTGTVLYGGAATIIGMGLLASWSRGAWLGTAVSMTVVLLIYGGRFIKSAALAGTAALLVLGPALARFIPGSITDRLSDLPAYVGMGMWEVVQQPVTDENFSVIERLAHWIAALRMWELSPWLGVGPGNYAAVYPQVRLPRWEEPLGHAHNIYLNVLAENGLIGMFSYLTLWTGVVVWLVCTRRRILRTEYEIHDRQDSEQPASSAAIPASSWTAALFLGVLGVIAHLSVHHLFDNLYVQGMYLHVALWLGAAIALVKDRLAVTISAPAPAPFPGPRPSAAAQTAGRAQ